MIEEVNWINKMVPSQLGLKYGSWRPGQAGAIEQASSSTKRIILIEAPTGTGKTLLGLGLALVNSWRAYFLTANKTLQDQYVEEGNGMVRRMVGRQNYKCVLWKFHPGEAASRGAAMDTSVDNAPCASGYQCPVKKWCGYFVDKKEVMAGLLSAHNYSYWLPESEYAGGFSDTDLIVADEAHLLDNVICKFLAINLDSKTLSYMKQMGAMPANDSIMQWKKAGEAAETGAREALLLQEEGTVNASRWKRRLSLYQRLAAIDTEHNRYVVNKAAWSTSIVPVWPIGVEKLLMGHKARKLVMMTATVIDKEMFLDVLGFNPDDVEFIKMPWVFPPYTRPVYYRPVAEVTRETTIAAASNLAGACDDVLSKREGEKGVIHTHSFRLLDAVVPYIKNLHRIVVQTRGADRLQLITSFKAEGGSRWLVSPSVEHGENFAGDIARNQIILKIPFPNLGDEAVRIRSRQKHWWYKFATVQNLVQMIGRLTRSDRDYGETYIFDGKLESVMELIPQEVKAAMK